MAAVVLYGAGIRDITSAAQAALALKPLAGEFAFMLFAGGVIGTGLSFTSIDPMKALYWSAIMIGLMLLASNKTVMGPFVSGVKTRWFGWIGAGIMGLAVLMMLWGVWPGRYSSA